MDKEELSRIIEGHTKWLKDSSCGKRANLSGADLSEVNLSGADLRWADLSWADLSGADLRGADLSGADLSEVNLRGADLRGADLSEVNLRWADLSWADLRGADLRGADLSGANLKYSCWPLWCGSLEIGAVDDVLALQLLAHVARLPTKGLTGDVAALITGLPELAKNGFCKREPMVKPI